jgi:Putative Flp pilus-assembly TadE/G-like
MMRTALTKERSTMLRTIGDSSRTSERGQTLTLFALGLVVLLLGAGLVVDGGNAFAQQRVTQNGSDAAANAGAVALVKNVAAQTLTNLPTTDGDVLNAVDAAAVSNSLATPIAYYTTVAGQCILTTGGTAPPPCSAVANAVKVGNGVIPTVAPDANGQPQCPLPYGVAASTWAPACGVAVFGAKTFGTYLVGIVGIRQWTASASATAIAGAATGICPAGSPCGFLPLTFPIGLTLCDGSNKQVDFPGGAPYNIATPPFNSSNESIIPLCSTGPGSVGWLAIQPEDNACGGGVNDLACDITTPDNPPLTLPVWLQTQTGNTNSKQIQDAINNKYAGSIVGTYEPGSDAIVIIPLYDCLEDNVGQLHPGPACPNPPQKTSGNNTYYHIVSIASFIIDHAYIQANNPECNTTPGQPPVGGNGATGCLKGWFTEITQPTGPFGTGYGNPNVVFGVQLIR